MSAQRSHAPKHLISAFYFSDGFDEQGKSLSRLANQRKNVHMIEGRESHCVCVLACLPTAHA